MCMPRSNNNILLCIQFVIYDLFFLFCFIF